jgi:hypothetical protein
MIHKSSPILFPAVAVLVPESYIKNAKRIDTNQVQSYCHILPIEAFKLRINEPN